MSFSTESTSKNNSGGLRHRKVTNKQVTHHANTDCSEQCFVEMYRQYCLRRLEGAIPNAKGLVWYKKQAIGINTAVNVSVKQQE